MTDNPEKHVIDEIDRLVDETMAAGLDERGYPLDDYVQNHYPQCEDCRHDWHGVKCRYCGCEGKRANYTTKPGSLEIHYDVNDHVRVSGYTIADLEAMRSRPRLLLPDTAPPPPRFWYADELPREVAFRRLVEYIWTSLAQIMGLPDTEPLDVESWFGTLDCPPIPPEELLRDPEGH
jgi:hypothetical protein